MKSLLIPCVFALFATAAQAGWNEADTCGANLSGDSKLIYSKIRPVMVDGDRATNETTIRSTVKAMVSDGEISMLGARKNAKVAVGCLKKAGS
jgi:hypothetical protein